MHDLPTKNRWTGTRTITAAGNRTCIITLRLSDFKSQTSLTLLLRHYELTNENVSYFLTNQSKTKTFIDLKVTRKPKPTKNSTRPYLYEIPAHSTHELKSKGYDLIGVNLFHFKLMRFHFNKSGVTGAPYTTDITKCVLAILRESLLAWSHRLISLSSRLTFLLKML